MMKQAAWALGAICLLILPAGLAVSAGGDVAMVVDIKGGQAVYVSEAKKDRNVALMDFLAEGDRISLESGTVLVLNYFASGLREEIAGPGIITAGSESSLKGQGVQVKAAKVDYLPKKGAAGEADVQRAGAVAMRDLGFKRSKLRLTSPHRTAVRSGPAEFIWRPVPEAEEYNLVLRDSQGETVGQGTTDQTAYRLQTPPLVRGKEYTWSVKALAKGETLARGTGRFYLLSETSLERLNGALADLNKRYPEDSTESRIARAVLYRTYQLNEQARALLFGLRRQHPQNVNIIRMIRGLKANYRPEN
jgi:hypothetical protein